MESKWWNLASFICLTHLTNLVCSFESAGSALDADLVDCGVAAKGQPFQPVVRIRKSMTPNKFIQSIKDNHGEFRRCHVVVIRAPARENHDQPRWQRLQIFDYLKHTSKSINQSTINQPINQSIDRSINQSIDQSINQSIKLTNKNSANAWTKFLKNSINQSTNLRSCAWLKNGLFFRGHRTGRRKWFSERCSNQPESRNCFRRSEAVKYSRHMFTPWILGITKTHRSRADSLHPNSSLFRAFAMPLMGSGGITPCVRTCTIFVLPVVVILAGMRSPIIWKINGKTFSEKNFSKKKFFGKKNFFFEKRKIKQVWWRKVSNEKFYHAKYTHVVQNFILPIVTTPRTVKVDLVVVEDPRGTER